MLRGLYSHQKKGLCPKKCHIYIYIIYKILKRAAYTEDRNDCSFDTTKKNSNVKPQTCVIVGQSKTFDFCVSIQIFFLDAHLHRSFIYFHSHVLTEKPLKMPRTPIFNADESLFQLY